MRCEHDAEKFDRCFGSFGARGSNDHGWNDTGIGGLFLRPVEWLVLVVRQRPWLGLLWRSPL